MFLVSRILREKVVLLLSMESVCLFLRIVLGGRRELLFCSLFSASLGQMRFKDKGVSGKCFTFLGDSLTAGRFCPLPFLELFFS